MLPSGGDINASGAQSRTGVFDSAFGLNSSGWNVSTGSSKMSASTATGAGSSAGGSAFPWMLVGGALIAAVVLWKLSQK